MAEYNTAEELNIELEEAPSTDAMTGDRDKRMYLYYQLIRSISQAKQIDIIVSMWEHFLAQERFLFGTY